MIELKNITKRFDKLTAVNEVSLKIERIQRLAILGPSGSGKTTLLRLIAGFVEPDSGRIYINGRLANDPRILISPHRRNIGMVFQDLALWPHMNVEKNIGFGLENLIRDKEARQQEINNFLKMVNLEKKKHIYPSRLSGGEQQRVALARALIRKPEVLLLDEPLVNLDFELKQKLLQLILDLQKQFNITLIYVTHDEYVARYLAEKIAFIREGKIDQIGNKDEF